METGNRLEILRDLLDRLLIVVGRPVVQRQIVAFVIIFLLAWLIPYVLESISHRWLRRRSVATPAEEGSGLSWSQRLLRLARTIEFTVFPILGLLLGQAVVSYFESNGWRTGLIEELIPIFWLVLVYRILVGLLYATTTDETAKRYTRQLLTPLTVLIGLWLIWRTLSETFPLGDTVLFRMLDAQITLQTLLTAATSLYFFVVAAWIVRDLLKGAMSRRENADVGLTSAVTTTAYYAVLSLGVLTAMSIMGFNMTTLTVVLGGLSVGLSFGLQDLVANFVSGLLLLYERTLRLGDIIEVGGQRGTVDQLRMRSTVLRTIDNVEIFVPNRTLLTSTVETFTHTDRKVRRTVLAGVSYGSKPGEVREVLISAAERHGLVLKDPPPVALFMGFGDSSLDFQLNFWIDDPPRGLEVSSDLRFMIFSDFAKRGIEIPFPQRDIHVRGGASQNGDNLDGQPMSEVTALPA